MSKHLTTEIQAIKERNLRVDANKAWETSKTRIFSVSILTYISITLLMFVLNVDKPYLSSVIPTAGFLLSTVSIGFLKALWMKHIYTPHK